MERNRQTKIIAIIALCVAVVGLTLGFAAFSNTLTISSSATVTPNESDFKLTVYGIDEEINENNYYDMIQNISLYDSKEYSYPYVDNGVTALNAKINNDTLTISDISINFTEPNQEVIYFFKVANESEYDAFFKIEDYEKIIYSDPICTPGEGATPSLVEAACKEITYNLQLITPDFELVEDVVSTGSYKIEKDSYVVIGINIQYHTGSTSSYAARADGPFSVKWDDIKLDFSTAA